MIQVSCHCGAVRLEVASAPEKLTDCNCSICRRYGALWGYYTHETARVVSDRAAMKAYVWGDGNLEFYHCRACGCITHHERVNKRPDSTVAVNARLMDPDIVVSAEIRRLDGADTWKYLDD